MKHPRSCEKHHRRVRLQQLCVVGSHVRKVEHVSLNESLLYLLVCPVYEQFVVKIRFFSQPTREVDWVSQTSSIPVRFKQDAKLLGPTKSEHRNQNFTAFI